MKDSISDLIKSLPDSSITHDENGEYIWKHYPFIGKGIGTGDLSVFLNSKTCVWVSSKKPGREFGVVDREFSIHGASTSETHSILRYKSILIESKSHLKIVISIAKIAGFEFNFSSIDNQNSMIGLYLNFNCDGIASISDEVKYGFSEFFIPDVKELTHIPI